MGPGDWRAFGWYEENCSDFDADFGTTAPAFEALGLVGSQRRLFKMKLAEIHRAAKRIAQAKWDKERSSGNAGR